MNRYLNQFRLQFEKRVVDVYGKVTFAAAGVPTLVQPSSKGLISVTQNGAGIYTFVFGTSLAVGKDTYVKLLNVSHIFETSGPAPVVPIACITDLNISDPAQCSIQITFLTGAGAQANPGVGETLYIDFCMGDSTAP